MNRLITARTVNPMDDDYLESAAEAAREAEANVRASQVAIRSCYLGIAAGLLGVVGSLVVHESKIVALVGGTCVFAIGVIGVVVLKRQQTRVEDRLAMPAVHLVYGIAVAVATVSLALALVARQWWWAGVSAALLVMVAGAWYLWAQLNRHTDAEAGEQDV